VKLKPSITLALILLFFTSYTSVFAQNRPQNAVNFPRLEPDPKALDFYRLGRRGGGHTWQELAEIGLWASGLDPAGGAFSANLERIRTLTAALVNSPDLPSRTKEKADFILGFLHQNILRSYSVYQTRIDTSLENGVYNCVSSAVLYIILCEAAGIRTSAVVTREHAFVIVHINGEEIDVETTNRFGFEPGNRREFHDQFGRIGFTYVPVQNYRDRQAITKTELVSLILNNRIADMERRNNFAGSVPLAIDRAALLFGDALTIPSQNQSQESLFPDARKDLMDRLLNFGASLLRGNREEESIRWAQAASAKYPDSERWQEYTSAAVNNRLTRLIRERRITEAASFLESNKSILTDADYAHLESAVIDADLLQRANQIRTAEEGDSVIAAIEQARQAGKMNERRASELITFTIQKTATVLSAAPARDWRAAIRYIENALSRTGTNREIEQALRTYRNNLAADYHNRFAAEWNRRNYDEAERILNEGLAEFPDNRQLLANRETVNRHRSRQ